MNIQGKLPGSTHPMNLVVEGEIIPRIEPLQERGRPDFGGPDLYICGGFLDPPVNGFAGVDVNGKDLKPDGLHRAARGLATSGVIRFPSTLMMEVNGPR
jgi:N-acetylglucosamine-6-phosphate deacetylase